MSSHHIRIGVIGAGAIGPSHILAINQVEGCKLAAVCDIRPQAAAALAEENRVPYFTSIRDMLEAGAIDAATIATPSGFHLESALEVIEGGKHLLVEKPLEITPERIDRIIQAADRKGIKLAAVFQSRFRPVAQRLKRLFDCGVIGEIYSGSAYTKRYRTQEYYDSAGWRGTWKVDGGGCLMNQGIHLLDLFTWFLGDVDEVIAITDNIGRNVEVETLALSLVKFASGAKGVIEGATLAYPELPQYLEIFGSRGTVAFTSNRVLRMDLIDPTHEEAAERDALLALTSEHEARDAAAKAARDVPAGTAIPSVDMGHTPVIADFANAIRENRQPLVNGPEARRSVELVTAIYESGRNNSKPVRLRS